MKTFEVELGDRSYPIFIGSGVLDQEDLFRPHIRSGQVMIVSNETVAPLYLQTLEGCLRSVPRIESVILPDGEKYKNLEVMDVIYDGLLRNKFGRDVTLIALGGGVVGDMTGFAAATYQRGVDFIQVPTTLLSQVDSSVGGKTGVNHARGKNMIGAFHQPKCVVIDPRVLKTLPVREHSAGLAEVIKYGAICDPEFFAWLEGHMDALVQQDEQCLIEAIERSCKDKARVVAQDEFETGVRAILNYGHTFGHAIETGMGYGVWLHGEAVATGMCIAAHLSRQMGFITEKDAARVVQLCERAGLPVSPPKEMDAASMLEIMRVDKKNRDGRLRLVLLKQLGKAFVTDQVSLDLIRSAIHTYDACEYTLGSVTAR